MNNKKRILSILLLVFLSLHTSTLPEAQGVDASGDTEEFIGWTVLRKLTTPFLELADYVATEAVKADPEGMKHYNKSLSRTKESLEQQQGPDTEYQESHEKDLLKGYKDLRAHYPNLPDAVGNRMPGQPYKNFDAFVTDAQKDLAEWGKKLEPVEAELDQLSSSIETLRGASKPFIYFHNTMNVGSLFVGAYIGDKVWLNYVSPLLEAAAESPELAQLLHKIAKVELQRAKLQSQLSSITAETSSDTTKIKEAMVKLETLLQKYQQQLVTLNNGLSPSQSKSSKTRDILSAMTRLSLMSGSAVLSQAILYQALFCSLVPPARKLSVQEQSKLKQLKNQQRAVQKKHDEYLKKYKEANYECSKLKVQPKPYAEANSDLPFQVVEQNNHYIKSLNDLERSKKQHKKHIQYNLEDLEELEKNKDFEKKMIVDAIGRGISR